MMLALAFATWWLLLGVAAAAIPFLLHLLASVRAQEELFPTLRFLRMSMEKTARRRRIQHWLLLVLRALLLALLAIAVAEPISQAMGGWLGGRRYAAVLVLDNSFSMGAKSGQGTALDAAKRAAQAVLGGENPPVVAGLLTTNDGRSVPLMEQADLGALRQAVDATGLGYRAAPLATRVREAAEMLQKDATAEKAIYVFTDLQRTSADELIGLRDLAGSKDMHLFVVNVAAGPRVNLAVTDVRVAGEPVVDREMRIVATVLNSSDRGRSVQVNLRVDGAEQTGEQIDRYLGPGQAVQVPLRHCFRRPGTHTGEVFLTFPQAAGPDDLAVDNVRRFSLRIKQRVQALIVHGPDEPDVPWLDPTRLLALTLQPREDPEKPWAISSDVAPVAALGEAELDRYDILLFSEVPSFTRPQAERIAGFVAGGGTAAFFVGPAVDVANYNERFMQEMVADGGLLPGRLGQPVGQTGPDAPAEQATWRQTDHPFLAGMYPQASDYPPVTVRRYVPLPPRGVRGTTLLRFGDDERTGRILVVRRFASGGRVVLLTTTASPRWSNLPYPPVFLPVLERMCVLARRTTYTTSTHTAGAQVTIRPRLDPRATAASINAPKVEVTPPGAAPGEKPKKINVLDGAATFTDTARPGLYTWRLVQGADGTERTVDEGVFAVNPEGRESDLRTVRPEALSRTWDEGGGVYVGASPTEAATAAAPRSHNFWDLFAAVVVVLLVVEAVVANRRRALEAVPAHLNPRLGR